jgi:hypothetical protein
MHGNVGRRATPPRRPGTAARPSAIRLPHNDAVQIRIEGSDLPGRSCGPGPDAPGGHHNVRVAVQGRKPHDLLGLVAGDASSASWTLECTVAEGPGGVDCRGPQIQGPPGGRFIYLSWGAGEGAESFTMFRRAKLMLDAIPPDVIETAAELGLLVGRLGLTDHKGHPLCAAVRPPLIEWSAAAR